jgi:hypothetical protein
MENYICVSLGPNCQTSGAIKQLGYKKESYPFDWILSDLKIIIYSISTNFSEFLDRNNYCKTNNKTTLIDRNIKYLELMFAHSDPVNNETDFQYIVRCVNRFNNLDNDNRCKLFFHSIYENEIDNNQLLELDSILGLKFKKYKLILLIYINTSERSDYEIIYDKIIKINIYIKYTREIDYDIDKSIYNFHDKNKPIEEIIKKL